MPLEHSAPDFDESPNMLSPPVVKLSPSRLSPHLASIDYQSKTESFAVHPRSSLPTEKARAPESAHRFHHIWF
jgi:hypothetical protein